MCARSLRMCMNCTPSRNRRCENVGAIPSGATTVNLKPELVAVAQEPAAGEDLMTEARECEACVGDHAGGNKREKSTSEGAYLPNNDSPSAESEMLLLPNNHAHAAELETNDILAPSSRQDFDAGGMLLETLHDPHCVTASAVEAHALPPISLYLIRALPGKTFQCRYLALASTTHTARLFTGYPTYTCFRRETVVRNLLESLHVSLKRMPPNRQLKLSPLRLP